MTLKIITRAVLRVVLGFRRLVVKGSLATCGKRGGFSGGTCVVRVRGQICAITLKIPLARIDTMLAVGSLSNELPRAVSSTNQYKHCCFGYSTDLGS